MLKKEKINRRQNLKEEENLEQDENEDLAQHMKHRHISMHTILKIL